MIHYGKQIRDFPKDVLILQKETRAGLTFTGEASVMSSIHLQEIMYEGHHYKSSEHLYQYLKGDHNGAPKRVIDRIVNAPTGNLAFQEGKRIQEVPSWKKAELPLMKKVQNIKFTMQEENKKKLLDTFPLDLIFACPEFFWGGGEPFGDEAYTRGFYSGRNHLGVILMEIRDSLRLGKS